METLRSIIGGRLPWVCALLALTLCMKLAVPVGFMPVMADGGIELIVCDGMASAPAAAAVHVMSNHHQHHHGHDGPVKPDAPCPFAGLTAPVLGGADPVQLAIAIAAILVAGLFLTAVNRLRAVTHLRPPLRGPPLPA